MSLLQPPDYSLPADDIEFLQRDLEDQILRRKREPETHTKRRKILGYHGEKATEALLRQLEPSYRVEDMNCVSLNYPGFDFRIDDHIRVQSKGRCWVELIDFALSPLDKDVAWQSDIWITMDFCGFLDGRIGRLSDEPFAPINRIRWYIAPTAMLKEFVQSRCFEQKRVRAQFWRTSKAERTKYHYPELADFEGAFGWIDRALST
jgi:hypothetical protein